ncbi:MAG TPA: vanadium-dependent haloperoxidase [Burkholderiales bacterium]|nr:vanadium-dependent haloperoxidase [Burkholderiales bacterium]
MSYFQIGGVAAVVVLLMAPPAAHADVITQWNETAIATATAGGQNPLVASRTVTMVQTAMFDAVNSIENRYAPYTGRVAAPPGASAEAAAVAAAHAVLIALLPNQEPELEAAYSANLGRIPAGGKEAGVAVGERAAAEILARRAHDGANASKPYRPLTSPGVYVPTTMPVGTNWASVATWVMGSASQFRPGAPPPLASEQWARDYNEVKSLGGKHSSTRTKEQTDIGRFWVVVGPASWNPIVRQIADAPGRSLVDNARLLALVAIATSDAYIAVFDAKYAYNFWRPITAIRNGDTDGNDATVQDLDWEPLIDTPPHPEYPCAHCITSSAVATILNAEVGADAIARVTMTSASASGVTRRWNNTREYVDEVSAARIYGGVHYRTSAIVAQEMGRKIAELALRERMKPLR